MSLIADVVFVSAAAALAHFGVDYDAPERQPQAERTVARTQVRKVTPAAPAKSLDCVDKHPALLRT